LASEKLQGVTMVRNEYFRFLQTLKAAGTSPEIRKIANLVLDNIDEIQTLGTANGLRAKKIAGLAANRWNELRDEIKGTGKEAAVDNEAIKQLTSINIGPFRGFAKEEFLNLDSPLVLIYGPNGTGKSSFCEALEYGLLGSVEEAQSKRFSNQIDYFRNAHVDQFSAPKIEAINNDDEVTLVSPNEALYRFCFVEKNRIDNFSRIASHVPAKQTELISSLFGLDSFYEFVRNFSRDLDERHFGFVGKNSVKLKVKLQELDIHKQAIKNNKLSRIVQSGKEEKLAHKFSENMTFSDLVAVLGSDENPGEIKKLEVELQQKQPPITGLTTKAIEEIQTLVDSTYQKLLGKLAELTKASEGLSFKQLYGSLLDLKEISKDICPACKTPLSKAVKNPYELASVELEKLGHLAQLEQEKEHLEIEFTKTLKVVHSLLGVCVAQIRTGVEVNPLSHCLLGNEAGLNWKWWQDLEPGSQDKESHWFILTEQIKSLEQRDLTVNKANEEREPKQARLSELRKIKEEVIKLQANSKTLEDGTQMANSEIEDFNTKNKGLIEASENEKIVIQTNHIIAVSYSNFLDKLVSYKENLPRKLVADLGDSVVSLYNAFNRNDSPKDLLAVIKLPITSGNRIEISYQAAPDKFFDALHILSEGHIRCIGLAILLAKNLKTNSPLLIFDDPVNAIDDEHRSAIRETLFKDDFFKEKQIILACHGNEFFKDIHQLIGRKAAAGSESYKFLPQTGENHVHISSFKRPTNYVLTATELLKEGEYRDALMSSRRALEYLSEKAWSHYGKHCDKADSLISVSRRAPNAPWDLRQLVDNLRVKYGKSKAEIPSKNEIVDAFEILLGKNGQFPPWLYLNKGTHEENDREEFDHVVVEKIVSSLEKLDIALT